MKTFIFFVLIFSMMSCTNQMNGKKAAEQYCNCMKSNKSEKWDLYAYTICHAEMTKKYRFYRIFYIETKNKEFNENLPKATRDSTNKFIDAFLDRRNELGCH